MADEDPSKHLDRRDTAPPLVEELVPDPPRAEEAVWSDALIPVLTSTGRGSDVMVPMAIPSFGGMLVVLLSVFLVPVLYCLVREFIKHSGWSEPAVGIVILVTLFVGLIPMAIYCDIKARTAPRN